MKTIAALATVLALLASVCPAGQDAYAQALAAGGVVVCVGDSITDGNTYPQIIAQSLAQAGKPTPPIVCSGVASDTAPQMQARFDATALRYKPTLVTFSAGTNDSLRGVTVAQYQAALRDIAAQCKARNIPMILMTPCILSPRLDKQGQTIPDSVEKAQQGEAMGDKFEPVLRRVADEFGWRVAEVRRYQRIFRQAGGRVMSSDGIHPNYDGQALMARAVLDAMGYHDVPLAHPFAPPMFPGVIRQWKMRLAPDPKKPLDAQALAALKPDDAWVTYCLPEPAPDKPISAEEWREQVRRNGFGLHVTDRLGKGKAQAVAMVTSQSDRDVFVNTGVGLRSVWLNGERIHEQKGWTGYHAGKERIPAKLRKGENAIVVEIEGNDFFLSVTDELLWERRLEWAKKHPAPNDQDRSKDQR